jgi:hypothetical protein
LCHNRVMKIFLGGEYLMEKEAGWSAEVQGWQIGALSKVIKRRIFSYYYHGYQIDNRLSKEIELTRDCGIELFLDSGAFTADTKNKTIALDRYANFIHQHGNIFSAVANLDVIGDTGPKSWDNLKALEANGCSVIPVFHYGDDIIYLRRMLDGNYPIIALGGLVDSSQKVLQEWLDEIWDNYLKDKKGNPRRRVHGFGMTDFELMKSYPWYSVDSASWLMAGAYGGGCVFYEQDALITIIFSDDNPARFDAEHYNNLDEHLKSDVDRWLAAHGVTAKQCATHYSFRHLVNGATYQNLETIGTHFK